MQSKRTVVGRPPKLNAEQIAELQAWATARKALPTIKQMAAKLGVHKHTIAKYLTLGNFKHNVDE